MSSISDLALKGHFDQLKNKYEKKGMAKAGNKDSLLNAIKKAVGTIEDLYEKYPKSFTDKHIENYKSLISTLNKNGSTYNGHPDLMDFEEKNSFEKKPMQKASGPAKEVKRKRKAG